MAELARWQWDDIGVWRDFAEQYQAEMEASYQRRTKNVELTILPFGTFRMDLERMKQITVRGRNVGYERDIRRQARRIEVGYFILGCEGDVFASDSPVDQIEEPPVLEALLSLLRRIVNEPEDFEARSVQLGEEPFRTTLGRCEQAVQFLTERGFELIEEGNSRFLVFMIDEVGGLSEACKEVQARLERVRRQQAQGVNNSRENNAKAEAAEAPESNEVATTATPEEGEDETPNRTPGRGPRRSRKGEGKGRQKGRGRGSGRGGGGLLWRAKRQQDPFSLGPQTGDGASDASSSHQVPPASDALGREPSMVSDYLERTPTKAGSDSAPVGFGALTVQLVVPTKSVEKVVLEEETLEELLEAAKKLAGFRLPLLRTTPKGTPLGLACEPGLTVRQAAGLEPGARVLVEDFEAQFVERLQNGLLRLEDLALVAPLLDWGKPELPKLFTGRMRALLEGSCGAWCQAAGCSAEDELGYGRALLRRLYKDASLEARLEVCRQLLPVEKKEIKSVLRVDRAEFLTSAFTGLQGMSRQELQRHFTVQFVGEVAEDHGGPRRDFFGSLGSRLSRELPALWRRLGKGALVPVADLVAESTPKEARGGLEEVTAVYQGCGRACGLAAKHGDVIGEEFAVFFLHQVARDDTVGLEELQQQLSETDGYDVRATGLILRRSLDETGMRGLRMSRTITHTDLEVELVPGGKEMEVTEDNKAEWLQMHLQHKLYGCLQKAADAFRQGILDVFGGSRRTCPLLVLLTPSELASLWAGSPVGAEGVKQWREVACVSEEVSRQAGWLWEVLEEGDEELRGRVLRFSTGVHRIGQGGLQSFQVQPADGGDEALPRAMTCANMLQLPRYSSRTALEGQLRKAIEFCDGFQIL